METLILLTAALLVGLLGGAALVVPRRLGERAAARESEAFETAVARETGGDRPSTAPRRPRGLGTGKTYKFEAEFVGFALRAMPKNEETSKRAPQAPPPSAPPATEGFALVVDGETVKTSRSRASLQSFRSKNRTGGDIIAL